MKSKFMIIAAIIIGVLIVLFLLGRKSVHTEIVIKANPGEVWKVLTNISEAKEWNKVLIPLEGELKEGNKIRYEFYQEPENKSVISATVKQIVEMELLNQSGGIPGILTFNHKYILEAVEEGTKVVIHEDYRGIMVPFWNPAPVEKAYERLLKALKNRVESLTL